MREIKFRAWHENKMITDIIGSQNGTITGVSSSDDLMQYTGLKDCNGKEIFEGDIVRWGMVSERSYEIWHRYAVVEINPDIQFRVLYYIIGKTGERKETDGHIFHFGNFAYKETHKHLEIIGNRYETLP